MSVFTDISQLPPFRNAVITIGTFDGVHLGHKAILSQVTKHAMDEKGESILITFEPHPRKILFPGQPLKLLTPLSKKIELIAAEGIQHIVVAPFTTSFSELSARDYIENFIVKYFKPATIVIGYDHRFGHDRTGDIILMRSLAEEFDYKIYEIPAQLIDEATVSSTKIRNALNAGQVSDAAHMLGRNYSLSGIVYHGAKRGRALGYPTANIQPNDSEQLIPANGIYAARINRKEQWYDAMMSIGYNPTVTDEQVLRIEAHLFDFDENLYDEELEIFFVERLRDEEKFDSLDALKIQLGKDRVAAMSALVK